MSGTPIILNNNLGKIFQPKIIDFINMGTTIEEFAQIFCGYLGIICYFSAVCSFGLFLAIFFKNKITSFFITSLTLAVFSFSHLLTLQLQLPTWLARLCQQISFSWHFDAAGKGILDSRDFIFYLLVTFAFLLSSIFSLKTKKRGCL